MSGDEEVETPNQESRSRSIDSISFVINASYTYTFGNVVFRMFKNQTTGFDLRNFEVGNAQLIIASIICVVMTLRYFFGNNNFIEDIFYSDKKAWVRFYHFFIVVVQSVLLLGASYATRDPEVFLLLFLILFATEIVWYFGCYWLDKEIFGYSTDIRTVFFSNQIVNFITLIFLFILVVCPCPSGIKMWIFFIVFVVNTIIDFKNNMNDYMQA